MNNTNNIVQYVVQFLIGFLLAIFLYKIVGWILRRARNDLKYTNLLVSTFGGGNRGVALMHLIIFIILAPSKDGGYNEMLSSFVMLDLGNFFFFIALLPKLIERDAKNIGLNVNGDIIIGMTDFSNSLRAYAFAITIAFLVLSGLLKKIGINIDRESVSIILNYSEESRKFLLLFLSTYYVFLRMDVNIHAFKMGMTLILSFVGFRLIAISAIFLFYYVLANLSISQTVNMVINSTIALPIIVLLLCPPSSLLPSLLYQMKFPDEETQHIDNVNGVIGLFFYFILFMFGFIFPVLPNL